MTDPTPTEASDRKRVGWVEARNPTPTVSANNPNTANAEEDEPDEDGETAAIAEGCELPDPEPGSPLAPGTLYLVPTPIGNLEDMTFRAVRVLRAADAIAAEDTRRTGRLLQRWRIRTPQLAYHEHNQARRTPELVDRLQRGEAIALVSDAGTPLISDPGAPLVRACVAANIPVVPLPGACAAIAALCGSGLPGDRFAFEGFLPVKGKARRSRLEALAAEPRTAILYEAPHRLLRTLGDLAEVLGSDRAIAVARELTKRHETFWRGSLGEAVAQWNRSGSEPDAPVLKGEFVLAIAGAEAAGAAPPSEADLKAELQALMDGGLSRSQASRQLAERTRLPRRDLYRLAIGLDDDGDPAAEADN